MDHPSGENLPDREAADEPRPTDAFAMPFYDPVEAERQRNTRRVQALLAGYEDLARVLEVADRLARELDYHPKALRDYRNTLIGDLVELSERAGARIIPRQQPARQQPVFEARLRPRCRIFVDECGNHRL